MYRANAQHFPRRYVGIKMVEKVKFRDPDSFRTVRPKNPFVITFLAQHSCINLTIVVSSSAVLLNSRFLLEKLI